MVKDDDVGSNNLGVSQRKGYSCVGSKRCCVHRNLTALFAKRDACALAGGLRDCATFTSYVTSLVCVEVGEIRVNLGVSEW